MGARWRFLAVATSVAVMASGAMLAAATLDSPAARAATPANGSVSAAKPTVTWANAAPMSGSAPSRRNQTCASASKPCDDFMLAIDRSGIAGDARLTIEITPSSGAQMNLLFYPPNCSGDPANTDNCYSVDSTDTNLINPANGTYLLRVACMACAASSYTAKATLEPVTFNLPAAADQSYSWAVKQLPHSADVQYGEPGISVNKLGHVIVNSFGPTVWISTDNGGTFGDPLTSVDPTPCSGASGDADAVVSNDDTYYADNLCLAGPTNLSYSSTDGGKTWNAGQGGLPNLPGAATDSDRQWYALDPNNPAVLYFSYHDFEGPNIWLNKSTDHGQTWTQQTPITLGAANFLDTGVGNTSARPLVDPTDSNTVTVFYTSNTAQQSATAPPTNTDFDLTQVWMARSTDGGKTFTNTEIFDAGQTAGLDNTIAHEFSSAAIDAAGNAYVVVSERLGNATQTHLELLAIPKGSTAKVKPVQVDQNGLGANVFPWIAAGDPGRVDISWYGSPAQDNNDPKAQWSQMFAQTLNALSGTPTFTQSRVSGVRPMHAADICLPGVQVRRGKLGPGQMIAVDPCGMAEMVWTDDSTGPGLTMFAKQAGGASLRPTACAASLSTSPAAGTATPAATATPTAAPNGSLPKTGESMPFGPFGALALVAGLAGLYGVARIQRSVARSERQRA